jgi:hypothetical protein
MSFPVAAPSNLSPLPVSMASDEVPALYAETSLVTSFIGVMAHGHPIRIVGRIRDR